MGSTKKRNEEMDFFFSGAAQAPNKEITGSVFPRATVEAKCMMRSFGPVVQELEL